MQIMGMNLDEMPILKISWVICCIMILADVIMSCVVAAANDNEDGGHKSSGFVAIWSMFLVVAFGVMGTRVILSQKSTNLFVGFLLGFGGTCLLSGRDVPVPPLTTHPSHTLSSLFSSVSAGMLAQLFFAMSVYFFLMAKNDKEHDDHEHSEDQEAANDGMGAFCLINAIILGAWTAVLTLKKGELYLDSVSGLDDDVPPGNDKYDEAMIGQDGI